MRRRLAPIAVALVFLAGACSSGKAVTSANAQADNSVEAPEAIGLQVQDSAFGPILTDQDGNSLYAFTDDKQGGGSTCEAGCLATWPALLSRTDVAKGADVQADKISAITRAEGATQVTYNKWNLYHYVGDQDPGDVDGQGVDQKWFLLHADGTLVTETDPS